MQKPDDPDQTGEIRGLYAPAPRPTLRGTLLGGLFIGAPLIFVVLLCAWLIG